MSQAYAHRPQGASGAMRFVSRWLLIDQAGRCFAPAGLLCALARIVTLAALVDRPAGRSRPQGCHPCRNTSILRSQRPSVLAVVTLGHAQPAPLQALVRALWLAAQAESSVIYYAQRFPALYLALARPRVTS
jgi:hypothetical protein